MNKVGGGLNLLRDQKIKYNWDLYCKPKSKLVNLNLEHVKGVHTNIVQNGQFV